MKEEYFEKLNQLFMDKNFDEKTYMQIVEKYTTWYVKLEEDGKTDEEIQQLLKTPEDVVNVFVSKFSSVQTDATEEAVYDKTQNPTLESDSLELKDISISDNTLTEDSTKEDTLTEEVCTTKEIDPYLITRTSPKGKTLYYRKRSFVGSLSMFIVFLLVSLVVLPIIFSFFSVGLSLSFTSLLLIFTPVYYLLFINNFDTIGYIQAMPESDIILNNADNVYILPVEYVNSIIEQLNQVVSFDFSVFLQTVLISIFAFATLLICLYITYQSFKLNVNYFSFFFNKISLKKVKM